MEKIPGGMHTGLVLFFMLTTTIVTLLLAGSSHAQWTAIGPDSIQIDSIVIDPADSEIIYAGTGNKPSYKGLYKSTDKGKSWTPAIDVAWGGVYCLAVNPADTRIIYAGTNYGVYESTDGGTSWISSGTVPLSWNIRALAINPKNPQTIYAGANWGGVYKSNDGGTKWVSKGLFEYVFTSLVLDPVNPKIIYAGASGGVRGIFPGAFKSTDGGISWVPLMEAYPIFSLAINPENRRIIYAGTLYGIYKSTDRGENWSQINNGLTGHHVLSLAVDPTKPQTIYAGTMGYGVYKSIDGGMSWHRINSGLTSTKKTVNTLAVDPLSPQNVYAGTDCGVFKSTNGGESIPEAPTGVTASAGNALATVSFLAPSYNESLIVSYTVTSNPGGIKKSGPASPITLTGLTNGTTYTFTVKATNGANFNGPSSGRSNKVTPRASLEFILPLLLGESQ
ncbi:MAG: WD40/YVTN/BNR-like repeat-containing protein [Syntrophobacteraceae bacterium]